MSSMKMKQPNFESVRKSPQLYNTYEANSEEVPIFDNRFSQNPVGGCIVNESREETQEMGMSIMKILRGRCLSSIRVLPRRIITVICSSLEVLTTHRY